MSHYRLSEAFHLAYNAKVPQNSNLWSTVSRNDLLDVLYLEAFAVLRSTQLSLTPLNDRN